MRPSAILAVAGFALAGALGACQAQAHPYPDTARAAFDAQCRMGVEPCNCAWTEITKAMSHEEYETALAAFAEKGVMDPRIVRASVNCRR